MSVAKFADVAKGAKDLLSKSFKYENKVEVKTSTSTGVTYTAETVVSKPASASLKLEGASGNFRVDKFAIGTDKKIAGEFSLADAFPGTKVTFKATDGSRAAGADAITAVLGAEYKAASGNATVTADVDAIKGAIDATALTAYNGFLIGGAAKCTVSGGFGVTDYSALVGYKTKEYTLTAAAEKKLSTAFVAYYQTVSPTLTVAATAKFPLAAKATAESFNIEAGAAYKAAVDTTVTTKVTSTGKIAASYAQQVSPLAKLTFATEVDAANVASDDHKFGILVNITN